jgi:hypothetical protein
MNRRHPNHCACPRCGSRLPQEPTEMLDAVANEEMRRSLLLRGWDRKQKETPDE